MLDAPGAYQRPSFTRRLLRGFWRATRACLMAGMAMTPFVPPPPPPPPRHAEQREAGGQHHEDT
jgi:hypothetical protein